MPPVTSEAQRAELHKTIWRIANDLRGSVDGWDFKSYVLGMLFYRFISENLTSYINRMEREAGETNFDYAKLSDKDAEFGRKETVAEKGFYILPSELFENVRKKAPQDENLNETLERIFNHIESSAAGTESEDDLKGLFDDLDVNSQKLGASVAKRNEKLVKLLNAIGDLPLGNFEDNSIDVFGDAYEYLMQMYASSAGKSGGEYYTPQEVSELLARITVVGKTQVNKVYDPAVGSGSLLLQFVKVLGKENVRQGFYGQEINLTTYNLARINMFLHDVNYEKFNIAHGDTLIDPQHWDDEPFEAIVSNPPYSINWEGDSNPLLINDPRYAPAGVLAPQSKADLAFTMHMLSWLSVNGTAAIVEFPGVLYRPGAERKIRKYLIDNNYIDAVIQLPPDLFFGTPIATCIIVLKKSKKDNAVLFIDASAEFSRVGNKNKLLKENQERILNTFVSRQSEDQFSRLVQNAEIADQTYNLSVTTYIKKEVIESTFNIDDLETRISQLMAQQNEFRRKISEITKELADLLEDVAVPHEYLGSLGKRNKGTSITAGRMKQIQVENGPIRVFAGGQTVADVAEGSVPEKDVVRVPSIIVKSRGNIGFTYYERPFTHKAELSSYSINRPDVNLKFIYYFLLTCVDELQEKARANSVKLPQIGVKDTDSLRIPIPSIEIQQRIVEVLDGLGQSSMELQAALFAESQARKTQYEFFRDNLLSFVEATP